MTTQEKITIMQAFLDGKTILFKSKSRKEWYPMNRNEEPSFEPGWDFDNYDYEIEQDPKYRPYTSIKEFLQASKEHGPYLQTIDKNSIGYKTYLLPIAIRGAWLDFNGVVSYDNIRHDECTYNHLLGKYKWQDGTPCGIKE